MRLTPRQTAGCQACKSAIKQMQPKLWHVLLIHTLCNHLIRATIHIHARRSQISQQVCYCIDLAGQKMYLICLWLVRCAIMDRKVVRSTTQQRGGGHAQVGGGVSLVSCFHWAWASCSMAAPLASNDMSVCILQTHTCYPHCSISKVIK